MLLKLYRRPYAGHFFEPVVEECFFIQPERVFAQEDVQTLTWLLGSPLHVVSDTSHHADADVVEIGPRLSVETPFSSNAVAICRSMGLPVERVEMSRRFIFTDGNRDTITAANLDKMTQQVYDAPLSSFDLGIKPESVRFVPVLERGEEALRHANKTLGLGMDDWDIAHYTQLFRRLARNPTDVELFQIGNGNSEHSRHWYFRGIQVIDGIPMPASLMDIVKAPWRRDSGNSLVAFHDNAGVIEGRSVDVLLPKHAGQPSAFRRKRYVCHITSTAETHNHPTLISPFAGAETGAGGRIRDNRAVGRGGSAHAGVAGYATGNLHLGGYRIPGEVTGGPSNRRHASPRDILINGSNGVSDYGNKIGEPLIGGFCRTFGLMVDGRRREFAKPVLYSGGFGRVLSMHTIKRKPKKGMRIVRFGGPAYRIGVGGGSASSMISGEQDEGLDFSSVQRGNAEMENRVNRVIQTCVELCEKNPIESIHDQGAGGPSNVLTELMEPVGGRVDIRKIVLGDKTMSVLEIWVAEYQEGYGVLVKPENLEVFQSICSRERVNCEVLGELTGDGSIVVCDSYNGTTPVDLSLGDILSEMPPKRFESTRLSFTLPPLYIPEELTVEKAVQEVCRLPQVGSKGFLVWKVDRSVTGLVARQQCCGPMQVPVADVAVTADGYFDKGGAATALGEQPGKMLISPEAGARMAVAEMLTNLASVRISKLSDVKCRANWMWAAKLPGEGPRLYDAAVAMSAFMEELGVAIDGGKDSLSMAAHEDDELVVSPGQLVIKGYAPVPDITKVVTPDLKPGNTGVGIIGLIDLGQGKNRLGGSSLAQVLGQLGDEPPDIDDADFLRRAFCAVQELIEVGAIRAYHDRSDGGLIVALAEMCIAGNCGARVHLPRGSDVFAELFNEEAGMLFEYASGNIELVRGILKKHGVPERSLSAVSCRKWERLEVRSHNKLVFSRSITELRQWWEATSTELERQQANPETVEAESTSHAQARMPVYAISFEPKAPALTRSRPAKVAVVREEGTNGDREMAAAFYTAGLEPVDIAMQDLHAGALDSLDDFRGLVFPGGFSYADVFGSGKGWAGSIRFNSRLADMFARFYERENTFSLGVCNGCQLMAILGWALPSQSIPETDQPRFVHNLSGRFESRWARVKILPSPAIMLSGMEDSVLGVWVAHGEGRLLFPDERVARAVAKQKLAPLAYVDPEGNPTDAYPYNPNGSPHGWTALCSPDGRHLAMMPHPERCFLPWQWPWMPEEFRKLEASPWLQMFHNARDWCLQ